MHQSAHIFQWQQRLSFVWVCFAFFMIAQPLSANAQTHLLLARDQIDDARPADNQMTNDNIYSTVANLSDEQIRLWLLQKLASEIEEREKAAHNDMPVMSFLSADGVVELRKQISGIWIGASFEWQQLDEYLDAIEPGLTKNEFVRIIVREAAQSLFLLILITLPFWLIRRTAIHKYTGKATTNFEILLTHCLALMIDAFHIAVFYATMLITPVFIGPMFGPTLSDGMAPIVQYMILMITMILVFRAIIRFLLSPFTPKLKLHNIPDPINRVLYFYILLIVSLMVIAWEITQIVSYIGMSFEVEFLVIATFQIIFMFSAFSGLASGARVSNVYFAQKQNDNNTPSKKRGMMRYWWIVVCAFVAFVSVLFLINVLLLGTVPRFDSEPYLFVGLAAIPVADKLITDLIRNSFREYHKGLDVLVAQSLSDSPEIFTEHGDESSVQSMDRMVYERQVTERVKFNQEMMQRLETYFVKAVRRLFVITIIFIAIGDLITQQEAYGANVSYINLLNVGANLFITLVAGWFLWGLIVALLDDGKRGIKIQTPGMDDGVGMEEGSRSETLLPLFRTILQILLILVIIMTGLAAIGIDIGPLLASAGIIGIAIGFGAQALIRDVVSGVFFLVDDAFRVSEYIDIGAVKGRVEKISVRSVRMRHHRGAVHTVPFGEIKHMTNYSRDWVVMKLDFRVHFDTDIEQVRKLIKKVGVLMAEDPAHAGKFLGPLKSQGVHRTEESALIIRAKFTCRPGDQWLIRRDAYRKIRDIFAANNIKFASRVITVESPDSEFDKIGAAAEAINTPGQTTSNAGAAR